MRIQWKQRLTFASADALHLMMKNMPEGIPGGPKMIGSHQARNDPGIAIYYPTLSVPFMRCNTV